MRGCLLLVGSFAGWLVIGVALIFSLSLFLPEEIATAIGTGVWLLGGITTLMFGSISLADVEDLAPPPTDPTTIADWRRVKAESKVQAAELRVAFVYALVAIGMASAVKSPVWVCVVIGIAFALIGGIVGYLCKRLFLARRDEVERNA